MAGIFSYRYGDFLRKATRDEYKRYLSQIAKLPSSERTVGVVDGERYGFPGLTIWMEE
jgi:hypothetical protein